jgi:hypothetical protein
MTLVPGGRLGAYEIVGLLGAGGMGEVYSATDTRLRRSVALKLLPATHATDPDRLRRFEQEALAAAALSHPNILAVYDIGADEHGTYLVSELLEGHTLRESLLHSALPLRKTLDYAIQIANGLAAAHEKGIVHRDLKPENVFVTRDGRVKILDFGLAKLHRTLDPDGQTSGATISEITDPGVVLGTVGYMSPEQVQARRVDQRSDLFSFGSMLYEMLTGYRAFRRDSAVETMNAILKEDPPELTDTNKSMSPLLSRIVRRCLEKNPDLRFRSAQDLAFALETLSVGGSSTSLPAIVSARRRRWVPLTAAGLALLVLPLIGFVAAQRLAAEHSVPSFHRLTFRRGGAPAARFAPDGRTILYAAAWDADPVRIFSTRIERPESSRLDLPDAGIEAISPSSELLIMLGRHLGNFWETCTLAQVPLGGGAPRPLADNVLGADWGPDGTIAVVREVAGRYRLEYPIGHSLYESKDGLNSPRVSRSGDLVAFWAIEKGDMAIGIVSRTGAKRTLSTGWQGVGRYLVWSPRNDELWFSANEGTKEGIWGYQLRAVAMSGKQRVLMRLPATVYPQDISADGRSLIIGIGALRSVARCLPPGEDRECDLSWFGATSIRDLTPDGKIALISESFGGTRQGTAISYIRKTDGSPPVRLSETSPIVLSADGKWIVSQHEGGAFTLLPTGAGEHRPIDMKGFDRVFWYPDSRRLLLSPGAPRAGARCASYDIEKGTQTPVAPDGFVCPVGPSAEGNMLLLQDRAERWFTHTSATGLTRPLPGLTTNDRPLQWSADSRSLFVAREWLPFAKIDRVDVATGQRRLSREIVLSDPAGFNPAVSNLVVAPNGSYCYSYLQGLSELYVVEGIQ